jgi:hypothetical protein
MMRIPRVLLCLPISVLCAASALAQGSDDCSTATPISGPGTFPVSTVNATDSAQQSTGCPLAHRDVWFAWTSTQSGPVRVQFCGGTTADTVVAAYTGASCPVSGTQIACNDDSCGLQSMITFTATSGSTYLLQMGAFSTAVTYTGTFGIDFPGPTANDDCATPLVIAGNGPFNFDNTFSTTGTQGQAESLCNFTGGTAVTRDLWFTWTANFTNAHALVDSCSGTTANTKIAVYAGAGCPSAPALACSDDTCGVQAQANFNCQQGQTYTIQLGITANGTAGGSGTFRIGTVTGGCPNPSVGPDVIVGNITDVANVTAVGGIDALSLGTDACNIGDVPLPWVASTNHHPVIGGSLYRYHVVAGAGRFEQVGMSWLKHAFAAGAGSTCCTCQGGGGGGLGVGCSDVYGAGLNGSQSGLGPRWQVNAHTGVFTYPPANPAFSGALARRCQASVSELEVSGGTTHFFGETTYVTQEDAAASNNNNNSSYSELNVTGGPTDFSFALTGGTHRMEQALQAWRVVEPGVMLTNVQVPGDGLFIVGSHATSLGGGNWHYEYAVHNMNSDRNAGSFSVPIPSGASVSNIGFHDVAYHDGDGQGGVNFDGTDWTAVQSGGSLTWSTQTEGQNPNANALRWNTTYNFRFDANVGPGRGDVSFGLWKAGAPASMSAAGSVPSGTLAFCFGDGAGTACPCGNNSAVGANAGCLNSLGAAGVLTTSGNPSVSGDTFVLHAANLTNGFGLFYQGTTQENGGSGTVFGDGLRCAGGTIIRLGQKSSVSGASQYPGFLDASISSVGGVAPGDVRTYQCVYRNGANFCQPDSFNATNAIQTSWQP